MSEKQREELLAMIAQQTKLKEQALGQANFCAGYIAALESVLAAMGEDTKPVRQLKSVAKAAGVDSGE